MSVRPVTNWIICISGFTQNESRPSGIERIQDELHQQCVSATTRILLKHWTSPMKHVAERIWRRRPSDPRDLRITIIGYSYGGHTAKYLCRELRKRGITVNNLLLIDAIWRPYKYFPSLLSFLPFWSLTVPCNVENVYSWKQDQNLPRGHKIKLCNEQTSLHEFELETIHQYADDGTDVMRVAKELGCPELECETND